MEVEIAYVEAWVSWVGGWVGNLTCCQNGQSHERNGFFARHLYEPSICVRLAGPIAPPGGCLGPKQSYTATWIQPTMMDDVLGKLMRARKNWVPPVCISSKTTSCLYAVTRKHFE